MDPFRTQLVSQLAAKCAAFRQSWWIELDNYDDNGKASVAKLVPKRNGIFSGTSLMCVQLSRMVYRLGW